MQRAARAQGENGQGCREAEEARTGSAAGFRKLCRPRPISTAPASHLTASVAADESAPLLAGRRSWEGLGPMSVQSSRSGKEPATPGVAYMASSRNARTRQRQIVQ